MSESKYNDAWKKGFDSGVESQRQSCLFNCDQDYDEFAEGYNQALYDVLNCVEWDGYTLDIKMRIENLKK